MDVLGEWLANNGVEDIEYPLSRQAMSVLGVGKVGLYLRIVIQLSKDMVHAHAFVQGNKEVGNIGALDIYDF